MNKFHIAAYLILLLILSSCSKKKELKISVNVESEYHLSNEKISTVKVLFEESTSTSIKYNNEGAIKYAKRYAGLNDNSCGIYNNNPSAKLSDCAHFIAHCLKEGGIEIKAEEPNTSICTAGLCYRVTELTAALNKLSQTYSNVQTISIDNAIVGDYGFFKIPTIRPTHAFMICQPAATTDNITIYAHTTNRNCSKPEPKWYQFFDVAYRMTDSN